MGPMLVISVVGLSGFGGVVALVLFLARSSTRGRGRTGVLAFGFVLSALAVMAALNIVSVSYTRPPALLAAALAAALLLLAMFVVVGRDVGWRAGGVAALLGLFLATNALAVALAMAGVGGGLVRPLYAMRTRQIAEANSFTALVPASVELPTDTMPVEELPEGGLGLAYGDFAMHQRRASGPVTQARLREVAAPGTDPLDTGLVLPSAPEYVETTVQGRPALGVAYEFEDRHPDGGALIEKGVVLLFELHGVEVRMGSRSGLRESGGDWVPYRALTVEELVAVAETLESLR